MILDLNERTLGMREGNMREDRMEEETAESQVKSWVLMGKLLCDEVET